ncbi:MAG: toll/interleukin-1 receptor domain-containing protein [Verrucomicrobiales bacterium]
MSYSTRDDEMETIKPFVDRYADEMRRHVPYIPVFYDGFYVSDGHPHLEDYLAKAVHDSDFTTAFLSPGYVSSPWCACEWGCSLAYSQCDPKANKPLRHEMFAIKWKRYEWDRSNSLFEGRRSVDVSDELERRDFSKAIGIAAQETLRFLDYVYG